MCKNQIQKLQLIRNSAARLVTRTRKFEHITPILKDLHWLPVSQRIILKILLFVFKIIHNLAPSYLCDLINIKVPARFTRTALEIRINEYTPIPNIYYGGRAFPSAAPALWNDLPNFIMFAPNIDIFKRDLKTHLFTKHYC